MVKPAALALLFVALGAAPAPLVVGSVRDQLGVPISGAVITSGNAQTTTSDDGTFALSGQTAGAVHIACAFCQPIDVRVVPLQPVVAIVQRYQALIKRGPSERDFAALPYARTESAASLAPFTVLTDSRALLPGPRLSYLGASSQGSAISDDGFTGYDPVANISPFSTIPFFDLRQVTVFAPGDAFYYGDQSGAGLIAISGYPTQGKDQIAVTGHTAAVSAARFNDGNGFSAGASTTPQDARGRGSAIARWSDGLNALNFSVLGSQSQLERGSGRLSDSFEGARSEFERSGPIAVDAHLSVDRAGYSTWLGSSPLAAWWSDIDAGVSAQSQGVFRGFVGLGFRGSTGNYDASSLHLAGAISQAHVDAGVEQQTARADLRAGAGGYTTTYAGGNSGTSARLQAQALSSFLTGHYEISSQWSASLFLGTSFRLPALLETFARTPDTSALAVDRYAQITGMLSYTDLHRLRVDVTAMDEAVSSLDNGHVGSLGVSVGWQIAPLLLLRAWSLHFDDTTHPYETLLRFGRTPSSGSPGVLWLTYDNQSGARLDVIYRSDLVDAAPNRHLDASLSAPFAPNVRWFVGTEKRAGGRSLDTGFRFTSP